MNIKKLFGQHLGVVCDSGSGAGSSPPARPTWIAARRVLHRPQPESRSRQRLARRRKRSSQAICEVRVAHQR